MVEDLAGRSLLHALAYLPPIPPCTLSEGVLTA